MEGSKRSLLQAFLQQGFDALDAGDHERAVEICREVLGRRPKLPRAHYLAALIAIARGEREMARKALETTVKLYPQHAAAWARLAMMDLQDGRFVTAGECLGNAAKVQRGNGQTLDLIGTVFRLAGNLEAARDWHRRAAAAAPDDVSIQVNLANSELYCGDAGRAEEALRHSLQLVPAHPQAHWLLSRLLPASDDSHIAEMQAILPTLSDARARSYISYAIGKEYEDLERWSEAWDAIDAGARARRATVDFDEDTEKQAFAAAETRFTPEWLAGCTDGLADAAPVFIVGEPRTGSTLLERMLAAHDSVTSAGELKHFGFAVRRATRCDESRQFTAELVGAAAAANMEDVARAYLDSSSVVRGSTPHFIDKLPSNYRWLPMIAAALPQARIIHVRRDPMDHCWAMYKQLFADAYLYTYEPGELARHYARYHRMMQSWQERFGDRYIDVAYEDLVERPEETLRKVLAYVGLSWQPGCLEFAKSDTPVATASVAQVREDLHSRSVGRWRHYRDGLKSMREALLEAGVLNDART